MKTSVRNIRQSKRSGVPCSQHGVQQLCQLIAQSDLEFLRHLTQVNRSEAFPPAVIDAHCRGRAIARRNPSDPSKSNRKFYKSNHPPIYGVAANDFSANDAHPEKCDLNDGVLIRLKIKPAIFASSGESVSGHFVRL